MAETRQSFTTEIDATPDQCFDAIMDFAAYPKWSSVITRAVVLERDDDDVTRRVEFELDVKVKKIRYVLDYTASRPARLEWKLVAGDLEDVEGIYTFEQAGKRKTRATCEQAVSLGFWLPGPIRRIAEQKALRDSVLQFKAEVERRRRARAQTPIGHRGR